MPNADLRAFNQHSAIENQQFSEESIAFQSAISNQKSAIQRRIQ
jgi:hypothetical protein